MSKRQSVCGQCGLRSHCAPVLSPPEVDELRTQLDAASPLEIMDKALELFGDDAAIAFSGAEDVALIETRVPHRADPSASSASTQAASDPETYRFLEKVKALPARMLESQLVGLAGCS